MAGDAQPSAVRNAFDERLIAALRRWADDVAKAADAGDARVAVIAGAGPVFSAGADLAWMQRHARLHARGQPA